MEILLYILLALMLAAVAMLTVMLIRQGKAEERIVDRLMEELEDDQRELRMELTDSVHKNVHNLGSLIAENQQSAYRAQSESLSQLRRVMADMGTRIEQQALHLAQSLIDLLQAIVYHLEGLCHALVDCALKLLIDYLAHLLQPLIIVVLLFLSLNQ